MRYNNVDVNLLEGQTSLELLGAVFPVYEFGLKCNKLNQAKDSLPCIYTLSEGEIGFKAQGVDVVKEEMEIDPWVANVTTLTGVGNANQKGYDVDYDSDGNLFVYGGGVSNGYTMSTPSAKIAKYNSAGNIQWTFNCRIDSLNWNTNYGYLSNFIIDKSTNKLYTGEGFNFETGSKIIRLKNTGIYDNFISDTHKKYNECWEFQFDCATSNIIVMGGSNVSNLNAGIINKTTGALKTENITGIASPGGQDILSACIDNSGQLYVIFASGTIQYGHNYVSNRIYKVNPAINGNIWNRPSGYYSFHELENRIHAGNSVSNGFNALSANNKYLFYYDGKNLKAFRLTNGDSVGLPFSIGVHNLLMQGGIESDNCNNVYVGGNNGNVLVYNFDGFIFNFVRQVAINGHSGKSIYDLKANKKNNNLYISGDGFVAETSFTSCDSALIALNFVSNCVNKAVVTVPNSFNGSTFDYIWTDTTTNTIVQSKYNTSQVKDTFLNGSIGKTYKVSINRNSNCLPVNVVRYISFKPDTAVHKDTVFTCGSYTIGNKTYTLSGVYRDTIEEIGCPKIVLTTLTINQIKLDTIRKTLCAGDSINIKGQFVKMSGVYRDTLITLKGCDSILVYIISTSSASANTIQLYDTICSDKSYLFKSKNITSAGTYYDTIKRSGKCDSFVVLNLIVNNASAHTINQTICQGQSVQIGSNTYNSTGTFVITLKNSNNCDSIVTLNLKVNSVTAHTINQTICQGQSVQVGGKIFNSTGTFVEILKDINNCDSIVTLNLKVNPKYFLANKQSICYPKSVNFYGQNYNKSGLYYKKFQTVNGCDSIYELDLRILRIIGIENYEFCKGDSLKILNRYVKTSGDYYDTFKIPSGCDSFHLTKVNVRTWPVQQIDTVLCADDSFIYKNKVYKQAAIISDTIFSNYKTSCHKLKFIYLDFKNCDTLNECNRILIPTGFTPNNDGINEKLSLIVKSEKINIVDFVLYNRWGHIVYNYYDDKEGWNGLYKGDDAPVGVYNYSLKYKCKGQNYTKSGNVTLLR
jgi:gliding motility-associated-like protein